MYVKDSSLKMLFQNHVYVTSVSRHRVSQQHHFFGSFLYLLLLYHTLPSSSLCTTTALKHKGKQKKQNVNINFNKSMSCSINVCFVISLSHLPSDGFDLTDKVGKFAVSCVWQQHTEKRSHYASCTKNKKWQNLHVQTCKQSRTCII